MIERPEVLREALIVALRRRWDRPLTFVHAGAGYGKSTVLRQALADNRMAERGVDFALRLTPSLDDASLLGAAIASTLDPTSELVHPDAGAIVDLMVRHSPVDVCLVLDDVHHLDPDGDGAALLAQLVAALPSNGHLLIAGRTPPPFPTARLRVLGLAAAIDDESLGFDDRELDQLADLYGRPGTDLEGMGSWPALADLAARGERVDGTALLAGAAWRLTEQQRAAIAALLVLGPFDATALARATGFASEDDLELDRVPMVLRHDGATVSAHDLWADVIDPSVVDEELLIRATDTISTVGRMAELFDHANRNGHLALMRSIATRTLASMALAATPSLLRRWSTGVERQAGDDDPVWLLLEGSLAVAEGLGGDGVELLLEAQRRFERDGNEQGEVAALGRLIQQARVGQDQELLGRIFHRVTTLAERWPQMGTTTAFVTAAMHEAAGDFDRAIECIESVLEPRLDRPTRVLLRQYQIWLAMLAGRIGEFRDQAEQNALDERDRRVHVDDYLILVDWFSGRPTREPMLRSEHPTGLARHRFIEVTNRSLIAVSVGSGDLATDEELAHGATTSQADRYLIALVRASLAVHEGDETAARGLLTDAFDTLGPPEGTALGHVLRFGAYAAVLCPTIVSEAAASAGHEHRQRLATARALIEARAGTLDDWSAVPEPRWWITALPLAWSVELTLRAHDADRLAMASAALDLLDDYCGPALRATVDRVVALVPELDNAAKHLTRSLPGTPMGTVTVRVSGELSIEHSWTDEQPQRLPRPKVVQLLLALVALGPVTRERLVDELWPDMTLERGLSNLRTSLSYLRSMLEPGRPASRPSAFLQDRGAIVDLVRRPELVVDVARVRDLAARARHGDVASTSAELIGSCLEIVELWRGDTAHTVRGVAVIDDYLDAVADDVVWAHTTLAETDLARDRAEEAAARLAHPLRIRPDDTRALQLAVVAHRRLGLDDDARELAHRLVASSGSKGLEPGAAMVCRSVGIGVEPTVAEATSAAPTREGPKPRFTP